ncbi:MAG: sulfotransferase [Bacteroidales bacterium]|nr:sulfotransferase [Bacteroidales bacterium]
MKKIIYIAGLGHSGSTILDMCLGAHSKIVGLGEIYPVLTKVDKTRLFNNSTCSCGKKGIDCDFWGDAKALTETNKTTEEKYLDLISYFTDKYGEDVILLDSSKNTYPYLNFLKEKFELKVIFLTRDYRSWIYSRFSRTGKPMLYLGYRWLFENIKLLKILKKRKIQYFKVGYEEFALYPDLILKKICAFIELPFEETILNSKKTKSHIISGNIARTDKLKKSAVLYDAKWFISKRIMFIAPFFWFFSSFNNKYVYSNVKKGNIVAFGKKTENFYLFGDKRKEDHIKKFDN